MAVTYNAGNADVSESEHKELWADIARGHEDVAIFAAGLQEHLPKYDVPIEDQLYVRSRTRIAQEAEAAMPQKLPGDVARWLQVVGAEAGMKGLERAVDDLEVKLQRVGAGKNSLKDAITQLQLLLQEDNPFDAVQAEVESQATGIESDALKTWHTEVLEQINHVREKYPNANFQRKSEFTVMEESMHSHEYLDNWAHTDDGKPQRDVLDTLRSIKDDLSQRMEKVMQVLGCRAKTDPNAAIAADCEQKEQWLRQHAVHAGAPEASALVMPLSKLKAAVQDWVQKNKERVSGAVPAGLTDTETFRPQITASDVDIKDFIEGWEASSTMHCTAGAHYDTTLRVFVDPAYPVQVGLVNKDTDDYIKGWECGKVVNRMVLDVDGAKLCLLNTHQSFSDKVAANRGRNMVESLKKANEEAGGACTATIFVGDFNTRQNCEQRESGMHVALGPTWDHEFADKGSMDTLLRRSCSMPGQCVLDPTEGPASAAMADELNQMLYREQIRCYQKSKKSPDVAMADIFDPLDRWLVECRCPADVGLGMPSSKGIERVFTTSDRFPLLSPEPGRREETPEMTQARAEGMFGDWAKCEGHSKGLCPMTCKTGLFSSTEPVCKYHDHLPTEGAIKVKYRITSDETGLLPYKLREADVVKFPPTYRYGRNQGSDEHKRLWVECFTKDWYGDSVELCIENPAKHEDGKHNPAWTDRILVAGAATTRKDSYDWQVLPTWHGCKSCDHAGLAAVFDVQVAHQVTV